MLQEETTFISETDKEILNEIFTTYINHSKVSYAHSILSCYPKVKYINNNICYHNMRGPCSSQFFKVFSRLCENTSAEEANKLINIIKHVHYNNIISECEDCDSGIFEFEHKYSSYFNFVIQKGDLNVAREIYVNLPVKIDDILDECHLSGSILDMMEIYQIITDWQDILPIERKGYSVKPLHSLFYNINYEKVEFYYTIHPEVFTDNDMYQALAIVKHKAPSQVSNFKDFFDTINENNNTLIKFAGKTI